MLDVLLYGYNRHGFLRLREKEFESLRELAGFFASTPGSPWEWAEVATTDPDGTPRIVYYSAKELREIAEVKGDQPGP